MIVGLVIMGELQGDNSLYVPVRVLLSCSYNHGKSNNFSQDFLTCLKSDS
jgi:hypothetical protein